MRLFTALDIPEDVRGALGTAVERWKPLAKISWSPIDNLHITTKFIGEWPEARLDELEGNARRGSWQGRDRDRDSRHRLVSRRTPPACVVGWRAGG